MFQSSDTVCNFFLHMQMQSDECAEGIPISDGSLYIHYDFDDKAG